MATDKLDLETALSKLIESVLQKHDCLIADLKIIEEARAQYINESHRKMFDA